MKPRRKFSHMTKRNLYERSVPQAHLRNSVLFDVQ